MSYQLTQQINDSVREDHEYGFEERDANSFTEFARALFLRLGAVLLVSAGTYLLFFGIAIALVGWVS